MASVNLRIPSTTASPSSEVEAGQSSHSSDLGGSIGDQQGANEDSEFEEDQMAGGREFDPYERDRDSALGADRSASTQSLTASVGDFRQEHGRTYHAYHAGKYFLPNDQVRICRCGVEKDRLDLQHYLCEITLGDRLYLSPLKSPMNALDIGTGTGIWAIEFADRHPGCQVTGIDLSPIQATWVPPNLKFVVDDAEESWSAGAKFDFIHVGFLGGCFTDWPSFFRQGFQHLECDGWLELSDLGLLARSQDGTHEDTEVLRWGELLCDASRKMGRPMELGVSGVLQRQMVDAGFVDVTKDVFVWPTNTWPKDKQLKEIGCWNLRNCLDGVQGFSLALLTRGLGWTKEEVDVLVAEVAADLQDRSIHAYFPMCVIRGRKP